MVECGTAVVVGFIVLLLASIKIFNSKIDHHSAKLLLMTSPDLTVMLIKSISIVGNVRN